MPISPKVPIFKNSETICIPIVQSIVLEHMLFNLQNNNSFISFEVHFYSGIEHSIGTEGAM